jgi:hypothetical protein
VVLISLLAGMVTITRFIILIITIHGVFIINTILIIDIVEPMAIVTLVCSITIINITEIVTFIITETVEIIALTELSVKYLVVKKVLLKIWGLF